MQSNTPSTPGAANGEAPKKFIRTFAGDINTFQKGGVPDLAPFEEVQQGTESPGEPPVGAPSIPLEPVPLPSQLRAAPPPVPIPTPEPTLVPPPPPAKPEVVEPQPATLQTYSGDFSERLKETHASTATVLAAEQDAGAKQVREESPARDDKSAWYIAGGIALLLIAVVGAGLAYVRYLDATAPIIVAPAAATPIFVDAREEISGTGTALLQAIKASVQKPLATNTVRLLTFATATSSSVFAAVAPRSPGILLRNIDASGSMAGVVDAGNGESPFFILSVESYSGTFSGMLSWESLMQSELALLYPLYPAPVAASSTASTTPSQATTTPQKPALSGAAAKGNFHDDVVSNHDVRVYRDVQGRSVMLYGYWNEETLVIARDPAAFTEILGRLATSHTK